MKSVFIVHHLHLLPHEQKDIKLIGAYGTRPLAIAAIARLSVQPGFCDHSELIDPLVDDSVEGFYVDEYAIDQDHWEEGFVTV
jgi:hypothetical protein